MDQSGNHELGKRFINIKKHVFYEINFPKRFTLLHSAYFPFSEYRSLLPLSFTDQLDLLEKLLSIVIVPEVNTKICGRFNLTRNYRVDREYVCMAK